MEKLLSHHIVPPDDFRYTHENGHTTMTRDWWSWIDQTRQHRVANNLAIPDNFVAVMEDQLCSVLPPGWCEQVDPNNPHVDTRMSWGDVENGSATFLDWAEQGNPLVSIEEANRRARICVGCQFNVNVSGCGRACRALLQKVFGLFTGRITESDPLLKTCAVCKCVNRVKVHFPIDLLAAHDKAEHQSSYPSFCWLKKGGDNYHA